MKTVARMVRRYILAAFAVVALVLTVNAALLLGIVVHFGSKNQQEGYFSVGRFAKDFTQTADGDFTLPPDLEWHKHFAWAMLRLVRQIVTAHGGQASFFNDGGAAAELSLPIQCG